MRIAMSSGAEAVVEDTEIEMLKATLRGHLLTGCCGGYDEARSVVNAIINRRPALIARCLGVADVIACVNFARARGLLVSVKGGGHDLSGLAVCDRGLMIDLSLMRGVWVDPARRTVLVQAGCLVGDVDQETQVHGLAAALGPVSNTGIGGLTLSGGFGYLTRSFGWSCDNVLSMEVVTAHGCVVRTSETEHCDLFWGLRGGGGNFGVVTSFEYKLHSVGPEIVGGAIAWRSADAREVLEMYRILTEQAPPELTCVAVLRIAPAVAWLPRDVHGKPIVAIFVCHTGSVREGEREVARIKAFGSPVGDIIQRRPYLSQQGLIDGAQPTGRRYYWKSEYLPKLEPELLVKVIEHAGRLVSRHSAIQLFPVNGAVNKVSEDHSPAGHRRAASVLSILASWEEADQDEENIAWARAAWRNMQCFSTGGASIQLLTEDDSECPHCAYGKNYKRLVRIKMRWDTGNLFRMNKNIPPV